ncbi:hypothetical protein PFMALIP_00144 [Plasmodium falciparum MaliPS096_E11]|uniref:Uncharacterized protein n=1 Tax=Plasmodium falciparum MaliPS096_E11 TaxID=1036727 RepID=A0A024WXB3_PLAFA|nr:hypothetical protein PFMALIP_00144 [Plasmodium falciparum MaliPS096_E11]
MLFYDIFCVLYKTHCKGQLKNNRILTISQNINPPNKKSFQKYEIQGEIKKKEYVQDLFVIDCSGLDKLSKNNSYNNTNQMKNKMFKEYEEMYSQLYGPKKKKKKITIYLKIH